MRRISCAGACIRDSIRIDKDQFGINDAKMRTTIDISDATLRELRKKAGETGRSFRDIVEETLQLGLAGSTGNTRRSRQKTYPVGIKSAYRGTSMNQLYDQLEAESHLKVAEE